MEVKNENEITNIMDPLFEIILHDPNYAAFRTPKGKVIITPHMVPRPNHPQDTTVPTIKYNGTVINPPKYTDSENTKEAKRTKEQIQAFTQWRSDIKARQNEIAKEKRASDKKTEERKDVNNQQKKDKRKASAKEAKSLVWWISYQSCGNYVPRFNGDRELALKTTLRVMAICDDWVKYCESNKIDEVMAVKYEEFKEQGLEYDDEKTQELEAVYRNINNESEDEGSIDQDIYSRDVDIEESGDVIFGAPSEPEEMENDELVPTPEFIKWFQTYGQNHLEFDEDIHRKQRIHWDVTCLEAPQDLNILMKRKKPLSDKHVKHITYILKTGQTLNEANRGTYMYPEITRCEHAFSIARYLAFGYCGDGHKTYADVDKTPLFGTGDIDIPSIYVRTWLTHAIEKAGITNINQLLPHQRDEKGVPKDGCRTWFSSIKCRENATVRMFNDLRAVLTAPATTSAEISDHNIRRKKLLAHAGQVCEKYGCTMETLWMYFAWHTINPKGFRDKILHHFASDRTDGDFKRHPALQGASGSGKTLIIRPLLGDHEMEYEGLLVRAETLAASGLTKWGNFFAPINVDCLVTTELEHALNEGYLLEGEIIALWDNTAQFRPAHCNWSIFTKLPVFTMAQFGQYKNVKDKGSLFNRLDNIKLQGGVMPTLTNKHKWMITKETMSTFLATENVMDLAPEWFKAAYTEQFHFIKKRKQRIKNGEDYVCVTKEYAEEAYAAHKKRFPALYPVNENVAKVTDVLFGLDDEVEDEPEIRKRKREEDNYFLEQL